MEGLTKLRLRALNKTSSLIYDTMYVINLL